LLKVASMLCILFSCVNFSYFSLLLFLLFAYYCEIDKTALIIHKIYPNNNNNNLILEKYFIKIIEIKRETRI
jgi:hypothetical protein